MSANASVVVVGASLAGWRAAQELRASGFAGPVTVIGEEPCRPYDRPPLSKDFLCDPSAGAVPLADLPEADSVTWRLGATANGLDLANRRVRVAGGPPQPFDQLVIATGASPWVPDAIDRRAPGVHLLRTVADAEALRSDLATARRVAIVGSGFIGCEVASVCCDLGLPVTVVDTIDEPLGRPLGRVVSRWLRDRHADRSVEWRLGQAVAHLETAGADGRVTGLRLADGSSVPADVVVVATGVRPNTGWLRGSGIDVLDGVRCDSRLRALDTSGEVVDGVVAVGDVARWFHPGYGRELRVEHWTTAADGAAVAAGTVLANTVPGRSAGAFDALPTFWSDQAGVRVSGVGLTAGADEVRIVEGSLESGRFVARYLHRGRHLGSVAVAMMRQLALERRSLAAAPVSSVT